MKNVVFGECFNRFEGIWQTKCFKDEEADELSMEEKAKSQKTGNTDKSDNDD